MSDLEPMYEVRFLVQTAEFGAIAVVLVAVAVAVLWWPWWPFQRQPYERTERTHKSGIATVTQWEETHRGDDVTLEPPTIKASAQLPDPGIETDPPGEQVSVRGLAGIDPEFTGDQNSDEYVRQLRDG